MSLHTIDIHSHLADHYFNEDRSEILSRMKDSGIGTIAIGVDAPSSRDAVMLAQEHDNVWACVGVHPEDGDVFDTQTFVTLLEHKKIVAIGECGLDYFRTDDKQTARSKQLPEFEKQIDFAIGHNLPLMLHVRPSKGSVDAYDEVIDLLESHSREYGEKLRGNAHFFAGNEQQAKRLFTIGFTISFTGVITFTNDYDEIVTMAPLDMLHAETDAPFVTPKPHRGKKNEPTYVSYVVEKIAEIKGIEIEKTKRTLLSNAKRIFGV